MFDIGPDFAYKTFFGVGSLGSNLEESLDQCQDLSDIGADFAFKTFPGVGSLGSNPEESLDPRQDLSDIGADFAYKTFPGVGSLSKHRWTPLYAPLATYHPLRHEIMPI